MSGGDDAVRMQRAIMSGGSYPPPGIDDTPGNRALWDEIAADIEAMPDGMLPDLPHDWPEP